MRCWIQASFVSSVFSRSACGPAETPPQGGLPDPVEEAQFCVPDRRIDGSHDQRGVCFGQGCERALGVVLVDGANAGDVDQHDAGRESGRDLDLDAGDLALVAGVARLVDVVAYVVERDLAFRAVPEPGEGPSAGPGTHSGRDRRHRLDSGRQELLADEGVHEGRFAALELADEKPDGTRLFVFSFAATEQIDQLLDRCGIAGILLVLGVGFGDQLFQTIVGLDGALLVVEVGLFLNAVDAVAVRPAVRILAL